MLGVTDPSASQLGGTPAVDNLVKNQQEHINRVEC